MKNFLLFTALILLLGSCCKKHYPSSSIVTDSVTEVHYVERDTNLIAPAAATGLRLPFSALNLLDLKGLGTPYTLAESKNKQATAKATARLNESGAPELHLECDCDSLAIAAKLKDRYERTAKITTITNTVTVKERYTPTVIKVLAWVGGIALALAGLKLFYKLKILSNATKI